MESDGRQLGDGEQLESLSIYRHPTLDEYRQMIEDGGCTNCGSPIHRCKHRWERPKEWSSWKCSDSECPLSEKYIELADNMMTVQIRKESEDETESEDGGD